MPLALAYRAKFLWPAAASPLHGGAADGEGEGADEDPAAAAGCSAAADHGRRGNAGECTISDAAERVAFVRLLLDATADPDLTVVW